MANQTRIAFALGQDESLRTQRFAEALQLSDLNTPDLEARLLRFQALLLQRHGDVEEAVELGRVVLQCTFEFDPIHLHFSQGTRRGVFASFVLIGCLGVYYIAGFVVEVVVG